MINMAEHNNGTDIPTQERRRSSRSRGSLSKAKDVLAKLRHHRETGEKILYEVDEQTNIYDVVDEEEYSKIVSKRREEDDWIVDDDGSGYVDDGREIFDDDLEDKPDARGQKGSKAKKPNQKGSLSGNIKTSRITNLFVAKSKKKKESDASVKEDNVLEDILQSLQSSNTGEKMISTEPTRTPKRSRMEQTHPRRLQNVANERKRSSVEGQPLSFTNRSESIEPSEVQSSNVPQDDDFKEEDRAANKVTNDGRAEEDHQVKKAVRSDDNVGQGAPLDEDSCDIDLNEMDIGMEELTSQTQVNGTEENKKMSYTAVLDSAWETKQEEEPLNDVQIDRSKLPLSEENGEKFLKFFWLDAYEDRLKQPGVVFLFGKVWIEETKSYVSCCCMVKNIERVLYLLPRKTKLDENGSETEEEVTLKDVYEEFDEISNGHKIMSFKCKETEKFYAFERLEVPKESKYLEIRYSAEHAPLPITLSGRTFSTVFGTNTSSLESLLMDQKLKGPSWLKIKEPCLSSQPMSWCKIEVVVDKMYSISVMEDKTVPPLTVLSLRLQTLPQQKGQSHEILAVAGLVHNQVYMDKASPQTIFNHHFCFVAKPSERLLPYDFQTILKKQTRNILITSSERSMLGLFLARLQLIDPDIIIGHDIVGFDFDVLLHRMAALKVPHWSKLGKLKRQLMPKLSIPGNPNNRHFGGDRSVACGRLIVDVKVSAQELIRSKSYDMTELTSVVLSKEREEIRPDEKEKLLSTSRDLLRLLEHSMMDAWLNLKMTYELNVIPLAYQITGICGNVMSRTLQGGRSERNEFLLLHAFSERNYICPDKTFASKKQQVNNDEDKDEGRGKGRTGRKKPAYSGGLVLEPKKGFYDRYVLLLDFNSLYPSIIQEFNICFTTISKSSSENPDEESIPPIPDSSLEFGVLPTEIKKLVERRRQVKGMMNGLKKSSDNYIQYDIRQKALKLTANSMYGCLGFSHSRFFAKPLAALVTYKGREILMKTKDLAESLGLDVIYGDTDSIMINTNSTDLSEVQKIGSQVKSEVNKLYKLLEIDIDGIYKSMLLLKKKKYAAVSVQRLDNGSIVENQEMKGLDIVRRDWCDLAKDAGEYVLAQILSCQARDVLIDKIHEYLMRVKEQVEANEIQIHKYEIRKALAKSPEEYPDAKALPHVTVAQRLISQGRRVAVGDTINYVICNDGSSLPSSQRAYHPDECLKNAALNIDTKYYLASQVHPVVSRLCDPIEGTNAAAIADSLGLDASQYKSSSHLESTDADTSLGLTTLMSSEDRFQDVEKFQVICENGQCSMSQTEIELQISSKLNWHCSSCQTAYNLNLVQNNLILSIRRHLQQYYQGFLACDDASCGSRTRQVRLSRSLSEQICHSCGKGHLRSMYSEGRLYNQLLYWKTLFQDSPPKGQEGIFQHILSKMKSFLEKSGYSRIDLSQLFSF